MKKQYYSNPFFDRDIENRKASSTISANDVLIVSFQHKFYFFHEKERKELALFPLELFTQVSLSSSFLGIQKDKKIWTAELTKANIESVSEILKGGRFYDVRDLVGQLENEQAALLAYALGINKWHQITRFCGACGVDTKSWENGHSKKCKNPKCSTIFYPQISPAIIVLIEYKPKKGQPLCLLSKRKIDKGYICSTFAGFVEIGESLEDAVAREMKEEVNVEVTNLRYVDSQPWSFSSSLMMGFVAEVEQMAFQVDGEEIKDAAWFSAEEIHKLASKGELTLSRPDSIARFLIETWANNNLN
ncbi:NAD+ diphosphatase [Aquimarina sp. MAR_2010_214]|uniref:NAD(+) diphosphatase n=1 Tax=Aquimarina sp. MAR_2010_214 TaxID=1250026 RepID=UPI000CB7EA61|nr:NAD(+) diphosphatase [Aquimarina sp. MAR_2010_214]PKV52715.1 NAD+ diphosphatase [Aquimarina sp. MAR_2010_214]